MACNHYLTAREAATTLGISPATLYAYVSRGLIRSEADGKSRRRRYHLEDVQVLKERQEQRKNPQKVAEGALHWGAAGDGVGHHPDCRRPFLLPWL
jgi:citrate synthase